MSGAVAERTKFAAYLIYTVVITAVIYPVVTHWAWGEGFLSAYASDIVFGDNGMIDFAGSTVVHSVGGWAALVGRSWLVRARASSTPTAASTRCPVTRCRWASSAS